MKRARQQLILDIIRDNQVETQEMLQKLLEDNGFAVTQATVSRDIKELKLLKTQSASGAYKYVAPSKSSDSGNISYSNILAHALVSIDYAMNDVVVKCHVGTAQAACAAIDSMDFPTIVGTLAGDDTIFIITRNESQAELLARRLRDYMG